MIIRHSIKLGEKFFVNPIGPMTRTPRNREEYETQFEQKVCFPFVGMKTDMSGKPIELVYVKVVDGVPLINRLKRG